MRLFAILILLAISTLAIGQLTGAQQKALNNYVDYANQSAEEVTAVVGAVIDYYPKIFEKKSWSVPRFVCPVQLEEYYYTKLNSETAVLGGSSAPLQASVKALRGAAEKIDAKCKALDTYHKLEDYEKDHYAAAETMVAELQVLIIDYNKKQRELSAALEKIYAKLAPSHAYSKTADAMKKQLARERAFLDLWRFNLKEDVPTGWITDELQKSISETDAALKSLRQNKPTLSYPASGMWPSFLESLGSILETKRRALDEYNFEAKKSDTHKNDVYLSLINYYDGALIADYNTFLGYAANDKFLGLKAIKYVPSYEINTKIEESEVKVKPFDDIERIPVKPTAQKIAISKDVFGSLSNYIDLINETYRQVSYHSDVIRNLNSSASYYASLTSYAGKGGLSFSHDDFKIPLSQFQKTLSESKTLPAEYATSLDQQSKVLINILKELDQIGALLEGEINEKKYERDRVKHVYELIERSNFLFNTWDEKKEILAQDVFRIFDSYPYADPDNSWTKSGKALRSLMELDREGLFKAKAFYKGQGSGPVPTEAIDSKLREVIANEYENMKGIEKYGRNNGLCPYTPYEDLPKNSKTLSEHLSKLAPAKPNQDRYQHPYYSISYSYNSVVDEYNTFCELSKVPHLKTVHQPSLFLVIPPEGEKTTSVTPQGTTVVVSTVPAATTSGIPAQNRTTTPSPQQQVKTIRDTVYIERRDTVFIHDNAENIRSMEGYAINNMVLLLDVSGSMNSPEKLPLLKKSVLDMLSMMRNEDEISIVVFSGKPKVLLPAVSFKDEAKIQEAINSLKPSGTTDGNAGLKLAYKVADENYIRGGNNRIVLATDGEFAVYAETEKLIEKFSHEDIFLTIFNFGKQSGSAKNLQRIATVGKGNYEFISKENVDIKLIGEAKAKRQK